jgi:hypothetical protein
MANFLILSKLSRHKELSISVIAAGIHAGMTEIYFYRNLGSVDI